MYTITNERCSVNITTGRNRIKTYGSSVYLQDGQKFELEIHNPHQFKVLAKIKLNGNCISSSGIILRPGERVYLERFIDKNEAFVYSTYTVDNTPSNAQAIARNGNVEVEFYQEFIPINYKTTITTWPNYNWPNYERPHTYYPHTGSSGTSGSPGTLGGTTTYMIASSMGDLNSDTKSLNMSQLNSLLETGRVESGEKTDQKFSYSSASFNSYTFETVSLRILPLSQVPIDIKKVRVYCTQCGTKKGPTDKFCRTCGTKF